MSELIKRLLAEETDLTDCAADQIEQLEAKLAKALELNWRKQNETTCHITDHMDRRVAVWLQTTRRHGVRRSNGRSY
jgi:hypothetical protein